MWSSFEDRRRLEHEQLLINGYQHRAMMTEHPPASIHSQLSQHERHLPEIDMTRQVPASTSAASFLQASAASTLSRAEIEFLSRRPSAQGHDHHQRQAALQVASVAASESFQRSSNSRSLSNSQVEQLNRTSPPLRLQDQFQYQRQANDKAAAFLRFTASSRPNQGEDVLHRRRPPPPGVLDHNDRHRYANGQAAPFLEASASPMPSIAQVKRLGSLPPQREQQQPAGAHAVVSSSRKSSTSPRPYHDEVEVLGSRPPPRSRGQHVPHRNNAIQAASLRELGALPRMHHAGPSQPQIPRPIQSAQEHLMTARDLHNQVHASNNSWASAAAAMLPRADDDTANIRYLSIQQGLAARVDGTEAPSHLQQCLRLRQLRGERERLEEQHALMLQLEQEQQQEISKQRAAEMSRNLLYGNRKLETSRQMPKVEYPSNLSRQVPKLGLPDVNSYSVRGRDDSGTKKMLPPIASVYDASFAPPRRSSPAVDKTATVTKEASFAPPRRSSPAVDKTATVTKEAQPEDQDLNKSKKKDAKWLNMLEELKDYRRLHGNCVVPRGFENSQLASWVAEQRKQYKLLKIGRQSSITEERVDLLNEVEFAWNAQAAAWVRQMEDLRIFHRENGHCNVPTDHRQFPKLGLWIKEQRRHFTLMKQGKSSHLTEERIAALNSVGFCYDTHETSFKERLKELATFKRESGHCNVPICFVKNKKLGTWVHHQRRQYKLHKEGQPCHITEERIRALEDIGIDWYPREKKRSSSGSGDGTASSDASSSGSDEEIDLDDYDFRPSKRQQLYNTDGDK